MLASKDINQFKNIQTIQESTFLENITPKQLDFFKGVLETTATPGLCLAVYRGTTKSQLFKTLSTKTTKYSENKLITNLFYFGEKAKHYYKYEDSAAQNLVWIKTIDKNTIETNKTIFTKIKNLLNTPPQIAKKITFFNRENSDFVKFFTTSNEDIFAEIATRNNLIRDYYIYFLHTAGKNGVTNESFLVSTSRNLDQAGFFGKGHEDKVIIHYLIPQNIEEHAVWHDNKLIIDLLNSSGLPIIKKPLYPSQQEISVRGALFSSHTLGIEFINEKKFIINPHIFTSHNSKTAIASRNGLYIDQSDFENQLSETSLSRAVGIRLDGSYYTIKS